MPEVMVDLRVENRLLKEQVAERNEVIERLKEENRLVKEGMADRNRIFMDLDKAGEELNAARDEIKRLRRANERLTTGTCLPEMPGDSFSRVEIKGDFKAKPIQGSIDELVAGGVLRPLAVGNALIQPTSVRIELPGGVVITVPQPKE